MKKDNEHTGEVKKGQYTFSEQGKYQEAMMKKNETLINILLKVYGFEKIYSEADKNYIYKYDNLNLEIRVFINSNSVDFFANKINSNKTMMIKLNDPFHVIELLGFIL